MKPRKTAPRDVLRKREHGWLRFNEGPDGWSIPDPEDPYRAEAAHAARYNLKNLTQHQAYLLAEVFEAYHHLATHPGGTEYTTGQLRAVRRALRFSDPRESVPRCNFTREILGPQSPVCHCSSCREYIRAINRKAIT